MLVLLALGAGALLAAQGPIYARLAGYVGGTLQAATLAFAVGLAALTGVSLLTGVGLPKATAIARVPPWLWAGGLIGTAMVLLTMTAVPRIGVATFVAAVVCGQLIAALVFDHIGAFGLQVRKVELPEIAGLVLLLAGLMMITAVHRS